MPACIQYRIYAGMVNYRLACAQWVWFKQFVKVHVGSIRLISAVALRPTATMYQSLEVGATWSNCKLTHLITKHSAHRLIDDRWLASRRSTYSSNATRITLSVADYFLHDATVSVHCYFLPATMPFHPSKNAHGHFDWLFYQPALYCSRCYTPICQY